MWKILHKKPVENDLGNDDVDTNDESKETEDVKPGSVCQSNSQNDDVEEDDDDFNSLLLCPDIAMDVDESPVMTSGDTESAASNSTEMLDSNSRCDPLFSTFVDEMTGSEISFNLTAEEQQLRKKLYGPNNPIEYSKIHCTACNVHLGSALAGQTNRFVHPLLKVLICKECYHFYTSGEFEKDEDGSEFYCRWCGQGGEVLCCTMCEFVFCKKCIRINFGRKKLTEVRDRDDWKCFRCDPSQLKALRAMCVEFFEYVKKATAVAAVSTDPYHINKDLTNCCQAQQKRQAVETESEKKEETPSRRSKKRKNDEDPDYNPFARQDSPEPPLPMAVASTSGTPVTLRPMPTLIPKPTLNEQAAEEATLTPEVVNDNRPFLPPSIREDE
ncbi:hypothetical protein WA026_009475 [Henosepilachna vigintioctopunctata]|uniref:PHD-type domain-containing protein n=1 Tax=Henosepilachna vigintioctopunctata TaxID=420089 RepID=A0AAW1U4U5_9CUCU